MSRLYANSATAREIAFRFAVTPGDDDEAAVPSETVEGKPGLAILETSGRRVLKTMTWGFPRLTHDMELRGDGPGRIGLVADLTNPMWEQVVVDTRYRCLIPLTHFANPNGEPGAKTRTWFSVAGEPLVAWAGFCRNTREFGPVFAGMTTTANGRVMPYNDRMPVLLGANEHDRWLHGTIQDVIGFQFRPPLDDTRTVIEHTEDLWRRGNPPASGMSQPALL